MCIRGEWLCSEELLIFILLPLIRIDSVCCLGARPLRSWHCNFSSVAGFWSLLLGLVKARDFPSPSPVALTPVDDVRGAGEKAPKDVA